MNNMEEARKRVALGAALLDRVRNDDWRKLINTGTLNIMLSTTCVLAQLHKGNYYVGHSAVHDAAHSLDIRLDRDWSTQYGFAGSCDCCTREDSDAVSTELLKWAWKELLMPVSDPLLDLLNDAS